MNETQPVIHELVSNLPQQGSVEWIGLRPQRKMPMEIVDSVNALAGGGLQGDRYHGGSGRRGVTLIQAEHLQVLASLLHVSEVRPEQLRRNLVIRGINLLALKQRRFRIGDAELEMTGLCHPCSRMESILGTGGYNAVRGHGGITARIVRGGIIRVGDRLVVTAAAAD